MNALPSQPLNDLLAELTQADAVEGEFGILFRNSEDVALGWVRIHAEQQIRRGKMKEAEGVRLRDLGETEDAAQFVGRRRNSYCKQRVTRFGRSDQMADRADAADARHQ